MGKASPIGVVRFPLHAALPDLGTPSCRGSTPIWKVLAAPDHWHEIYGSFFRNEENGATGMGIARLQGYGICLGIIVWCRLRISCGIPSSQRGKSGVVPCFWGFPVAG